MSAERARQYLETIITAMVTGTLDGEELQGPDGQWYAFATHIASEWASIEVDEDMRKKCQTPEGSSITLWKWLRCS